LQALHSRHLPTVSQAHPQTFTHGVIAANPMPTSVAEKLKNVDLSGDAMTAADNALEALGMKPKASAAQKEQARKARKGANLASKRKVTTPTAPPKSSTAPTAPNLTTASASELAGIGGVSFLAADYITGDIWTPNPAIPSIDETTYEQHKTQAEGQSRSLEVAGLNLRNINSLHKLEGQAVDIAITAKSNETRYAKLEGAEFDFQTQVQANGEKSEKLAQATDAYQFATRESGYRRELIGLRDENYQISIQQEQNLFNEKAARYQAQLTGGQ